MNIKLLPAIFALLIIAACGGAKKEDAQPVNIPAGNNNLTQKPYETAPTTGQIDSEPYEILATHHNTSVKNFHVLVKNIKTDSASLQKFADKFREKYCELKCNILLYDDKSVTPLVTKYPLTDKEYVQLAEHYIASSAFEVTGIALYPFKDDRYKTLEQNK